jgi:hypothetical protein
MTRCLAAICALSLLVQSAPPLVGVASAGPSASDKETARALMKDGETKRAKGDHKGALQSFRAAHAIMNVPTTGLELGRTQMDLGLLVEARDTLFSVTRLPVVPGESANMPAARDEAQKLADEIEPKIASLTIKLSGVPEGTKPKVTVDGNAILAETLGVPRKLNPGAHEIVVVAGSIEKKQSIELADGQSKELTIDVVEPAATPESSEPPADEPTPVAPPPSGTSSLVWIGFGSAAAFIVAGGITGALALSRASSAKEGCDGTRCPPSTHDDIESSKTFGNISTIAFALAGAGVIVGVIGIYSSPSDKPAAATTSVGLFIGANGLGLRGSF